MSTHSLLNSGISQHPHYRLMQAAIDLHESGATPLKYYGIQERIRNAKTPQEGMRHFREGNALTGGSFGDWVLRGRHWLQGTQKLVDQVNKGSSRLKDSINAIDSGLNGKALVRDDFPASIKSIIENNGTNKVTDLSAGRSPIDGMVNKAMNMMSLGQWGKLKGELPYDDVYHLYLKVTLEDGQVFIYEKGPFVTLEPDVGKYADRGGQIMSLPISTEFNLQQLLDAGLHTMGKSAFFSYNGFTNNCQAFVNGVLTGCAQRGYINYTAAAKDFVLQNTETLINGMHGGMSTFFNGLQTAASHADVVLRGKGLKKLARSGIASAIHFTDLKKGVSQPNDENSPIKASVQEAYPLTALSSGDSSHKLQAITRLPERSVLFLKKSIQHVLSHPESHQRHPLVTDDNLRFIADSPDSSTFKARSKITQHETGQGLFSDYKMSDGSVLPSWLNQNVLHPIYNYVLSPAIKSVSKLQ